ncbi:MAG: hypothetical protein AAF639_22045 [Chloroflexota bacterium]
MYTYLQELIRKQFPAYAAVEYQPKKLTRNEFYRLAEYCRDYASELAGQDQHRVHLQHCYRFNHWLLTIRQYDLFPASVKDLSFARPIARWQVLTLTLLIYLFLLLILPSQFSPQLNEVIRRGMLAFAIPLLIIGYLLPERLYGTTIELLESKVLLIVESMERLLQSGELEFTQAAFFKTKKNLEAARMELRQQIHLAHNQ